MNNLFLETLPLTGVSGDIVGTGLIDLTMTMIWIFVLFIIIFFALYIYLSIVYSKIGVKTKLNSPGIAWMPFWGWVAIVFESSKMHWWPFLMLMSGLSLGSLLNFSGGILIGILGLIIFFITGVTFTIMCIIWHWKTYQAVEKPGWWILVPVISMMVGIIFGILGVFATILSTLGMIIVILGILSHLILIGIAAWSKNQENTYPQERINQANTPRRRVNQANAY